MKRLLRALVKLPAAIPLRVSVPVLLLALPAVMAGWVSRRELKTAELRVERDGLDALREMVGSEQRRLEGFALRGDIEPLREEVAALGADPEIVIALVVRPDGEVLASTQLALLGMSVEEALASAGLPHPSSLDAELEQVRVLGEPVVRLDEGGTTALALSPLSLEVPLEPGLSASGALLAVRSLQAPKAAALRAARNELAQLFGVLLAVALFGWAWLHRALTRRVGRLVEVAGRFARGDQSARANLHGSDELARIGAAFDDMVEQRKTAQEALERSQQQVRMADRLATVGTIASGVAHEINNPLAYVLGNLDFALNALAQPVAAAGEREEIRSALADAVDGAQRVRRIVADMKTLSRGEGDAPAAVDLHATADAMLNIAAHELRQRARVVRCFQAAPQALGDAGRLSQVVLNLLVNAAQAIPAGAPERNEVRVTVAADADGAPFVEIADTGSGIAPEVLPRIFDAFFTTKPIGEGTGLGLSICRTLVTAMGGSIDVQSVVGKGTSFRVALRPAG